MKGELTLKSWKNGQFSASFLFISAFFKQKLQFFQQYNVKKVHPVSSAGIWTNNHLNASLLSWPQDQGSRSLFQQLLIDNIIIIVFNEFIW